MTVTTVLGIEVPPALVERWRDWFAPALQPFPTRFLGGGGAGIGRSTEPALSVRDTFHVYDDPSWTWLEQPEFEALDRTTRRALLRGRPATGRVSDLPAPARSLAEDHVVDSRIVWWPGLLRRVGDRPLLDYVEHGLPASRHGEVPPAVWEQARVLLPGAEARAGTFPAASGPNCFGAVLAAVQDGSTADRSQREPFDLWLSTRTRPVRGTGHDHQPGVVLVWRDRDGQAEHAAVTLGGGYAFSKPSQGWFSPFVVWSVRETIAASRFHGGVLSRHAVVA